MAQVKRMFTVTGIVTVVVEEEVVAYKELDGNDEQNNFIEAEEDESLLRLMEDAEKEGRMNVSEQADFKA